MTRLEAAILDCIEEVWRNPNKELVFFKNACSIWSLYNDDNNFIVRKNSKIIAIYVVTMKTSNLVKSINGLI